MRADGSAVEILSGHDELRVQVCHDLELWKFHATICPFHE